MEKYFGGAFDVGGYLGIYGAKVRVRRSTKGPQAKGNPLWRVPRACGPLVGLLASSRSSVVVFSSKENPKKVSFCLDSV